MGAWNNAFCNEYPINQQDNGAGKPGILIGRYPGDSYAGGNPWQLLTAAHAEIFYLGASAWVDQVLLHGNVKTTEEHQKWREVLYLGQCSLQYNDPKDQKPFINYFFL